MRNYLIIGGSTGIGRELVKSLESVDAKVYATYNKNAMDSSDQVKYFQWDVTGDMMNLDDLPEQIHGLAYCPGSINLKPFHRFSENDFVEDFKLQVVGATNIIKELLPRLKKSEDASILLFSTVAVQQGFNYHSQVAISKGAIEGLTRALASELAPNVRVNAIAPSLTDTPLAERFLNSAEKIESHAKNNPLKKVGAPEEVAEAAKFLLTPKSSWITGQIMHVDGGYSSLK